MNTQVASGCMIDGILTCQSQRVSFDIDIRCCLFHKLSIISIHISPRINHSKIELGIKVEII